MTNEHRISDILEELLVHGIDIITTDDIYMINVVCSDYLNNKYDNLSTISEILKISNILYNNTTRTVLPLEDGVYDLVVAKFDKETNGGAPVGAPPITVTIKDNDIGGRAPDVNVRTVPEKLQVVGFIKADQMSYFKELIRNDDPNPLDYVVSTHEVDQMIINNQDRINHSYPELVGTLFKCKFVTRDDAVNAGVAEDEGSVMMFDRDFLYPYFNLAAQYAYRKGKPVELVAELKYDGVSVEAVVMGDTIISACSRGDTANDVATDLTPIFGGYKFHRARSVDVGRTFGIKFECIITNTNLMRLERDHGIIYKNPRVAVIGLLGRLDAINFRDYLTLVPIKASGLLFADTGSELEFLNTNYTSGVYMRYAMLSGDYNSLIKQVKTFVDEAEYMRDCMDFMYDGVVISFTDPEVIRHLGRQNDKDLFSIAVKFNASAKTAYFKGWTFTVGQDGRITPMAHFTPVEFLGTVHDKTTAHSVKRFNELNLHEGDIVLITYVNDVICYISKPDNSYNRTRDMQLEPIEFPTHCPFCGTELEYSDSGDSCYCPNMNCPERVLGRVANILKKLGIKDFGKALLRKIGVKSFTELMNLNCAALSETLGEQTAANLQDRINEIQTKNWNDYRLFGAIGFTGISDVRWRTILEHIPYKKIVYMDPESLAVSLCHIKGIGQTMIDTILMEREFLLEDLETILKLHVIPSYGTGNPNAPQVRFSGIRDERLCEAFRAKGFDADGNKNVTNNTVILIVPHHGYNSSKVAKMRKPNVDCAILTPDEAWTYLNRI